jgi:CRISPR-associated protein Csb2
VKQYQPTSLEKSDKTKGEPWLRRAQTTLAVDSFVIMPANSAVLWIWHNLNFDGASKELSLLDQLLHRVTYFGRAESLSLMRRASRDENVAANCELQPESTYKSPSPVLISDPSQPLDIKVLLAHSDDRAIRSRRIPPGTTWWHAPHPKASPITPDRYVRNREPVSIMQFALGGRVLPKQESWIRVTERFRGTALDSLAKILMNRSDAKFRDLPPERQAQFSLLTGKTSPDQALTGHHLHLRVWLVPDDSGLPSRLVCYRSVPFEPIEQEAFLAASERTLNWQYGNPDWTIRVVPLPTGTALPLNCLGTSSGWETITPYVPARHVLGRNGKPRTGYSIEAQLQDDLGSIRLPKATVIVDETSRRWVKVHRPHRLREGQTNDLKLGYKIRLQFSSAVTGPISLGHSSHFGLGLFAPVVDLKKPE